MRLFEGFVTIPRYERWSGGLRLAADHAVVGYWPHGWRGRNRLPRNRLYLVDGPREAGSIRSGSHAIAMRAGHAYLMPPGLDLDLVFHPGLRMVAIHFDCELADGLDCFAGSDQLRHQRHPATRTRQLARRLRDCRSPGDLLAIQAAVLDLLASMVHLEWRELETRLVHQRRYRDLAAIVDRDGAATRIAAAAAELGLGPDQLGKRFKRDLGIPLKTWIDRRIARRAADLLTGSDRPIKAIAETLGFTSEFYCSRFLKRHLGMSPRAWRQAPPEARV